MGSIKKYRKITTFDVMKFVVGTLSAHFQTWVEYIFLILLPIYLGSVLNIYDYRLKSYEEKRMADTRLFKQA